MDNTRPLKAFKMNSRDWFADYSLEEATEHYIRMSHDLKVENPFELSDAEVEEMGLEDMLGNRRTYGMLAQGDMD